LNHTRQGVWEGQHYKSASYIPPCCPVKDPKVVCISENIPGGGLKEGSIAAVVEGGSIYGTVNDVRVHIKPHKMRGMVRKTKIGLVQNPLFSPLSIKNPSFLKRRTYGNPVSSARDWIWNHYQVIRR
jgi:hypothetical protein